MRPLYFILRILLPYVMTIFYRRSKTVNSQQKFNAQTIFVSNHPSAFIDPLVAGNFQLPILYFVTRGDIFKLWLRPVTWASHMVPIFRKAEDGADSFEKNEDSFRYLRKVLMRKKSLILFGEGYTDDTFIRSLKIIKKGPARIGFDTMVECNWEADIKVQACGINYGHPKHVRSDVLVSFGDCIHLKTYKELYDKNPNLAITQLTRDIQDSMRAQITYVDKKELAPFVEQIQILTRKGMNHFNHNDAIPLLDRYHYSQALANRVNEEYEEDSKWSELRSKLADYFKRLKSKKIEESWVQRYNEKKTKNTTANFALFWLGLPLTIIGLIHLFIPYFIVKRFVEKTFRRDVFWSGVKLLLGAAFALLINLPVIFLFYAYVYPSYTLGIAYFLIVPAVSGIFAYTQINAYKSLKKFKRTSETELKTLVSERAELLETIKKMKLD